MFMREVAFQRKVAEVRSFTKLYHNIQLSKLASLMDIRGDGALDEVRSDIMGARHKGRQVTWKEGSALKTGEAANTADVEFYMDNDLVIVKNAKTQKTNADWFVKQIQKAHACLSDGDALIVP
eukprot:GHVU01074108.1.p2 GENE.GHVU01074108.1~~GHVU01074108.1.p2  ORF type:complete len:123 (+),score=22.35 GHVU01074108.1:486-854(+)